MNLSVEIPHKNWSRKFDLNIAIETRVLRWGPVQKRQIHSRVLRSPHRSLEHGHYQGLQGAMMKKVHVDVSMQNHVISCAFSIMYINIVYMYICIWYIYRDYGCVQNLKEKIQHDIDDAPKSEANSKFALWALLTHVPSQNAVCIRLFHGFPWTLLQGKAHTPLFPDSPLFWEPASENLRNMTKSSQISRVRFWRLGLKWRWHAAACLEEQSLQGPQRGQ